MLENLGKPVIVTGSQLPIGKLRTDGKENLLTSIEIAAARNAQGEPMVPEVCIFFQSALMRGNRTTKINAEGFNAFRSYNLPPLAKAGIHIKYETHLIRRPDSSKPFKVNYLLDNHVVFLTLFPGIREEIVDLIPQVKGLKAVILKTYGAGNAPQRPWLVSRLKKMTEKGIIVVNITQCSKGRVEMGLYETSLQLIESGVLNGYDSTPESMIAKLMFLLGNNYSREDIVEMMNQSLRGEITTD
jgi:L-asparaginase